MRNVTVPVGSTNPPAIPPPSKASTNNGVGIRWTVWLMPPTLRSLQVTNICHLADLAGRAGGRGGDPHGVEADDRSSSAVLPRRLDAAHDLGDSRTRDPSRLESLESHVCELYHRREIRDRFMEMLDAQNHHGQDQQELVRNERGEITANAQVSRRRRLCARSQGPSHLGDGEWSRAEGRGCRNGLLLGLSPQVSRR